MGDSTAQTMIAIAAAICIATTIFLIYAGPLLFTDNTSWPLWIVLFLGPVLSLFISAGFLSLAQVSQNESIEFLPILKNSMFPTIGVTLFLYLSYFISFLRSFVTSAVPNIYSLTSEELILESKSRSTDQLKLYTDLMNQKQTILDAGVAHAYYTFWGSLFGTMLGMAFL